MSDNVKFAVKELINNLGKVNNHNMRLVEALQSLCKLVESLEKRIRNLENS